MDDSVILKGSTDATWEFELPEPGWHKAVISDDGLEVMTNKEDETKKTLKVPLMLNGGDKPSLSMFCYLGSNFGLKKVLDVVVCSGLASQLQKEKNLPDIATNGIEVKVIKSDKFINYLCAKLPNRPVDVEIEHGTYKDKEGNEKKSANVKRIRVPEGRGSGTASKSTTQAAQAPVEEDEW